jgi:hypothetical protein
MGKGNQLVNGETNPCRVVPEKEVHTFFKVEGTKNRRIDMTSRVLVDGRVFIHLYFITEGEITFNPHLEIQIGRMKMPFKLSYSCGTNAQWYKNNYPMPGANRACNQPKTSGQHWAFGAPGVCSAYIVCGRAFEPSIFSNKVVPNIIRSGDTLVAIKGQRLQFRYVKYKWLLERKPIPGANGSVVDLRGNGYYQVIVSDEYECTGVSETLLISDTTYRNITMISLSPYAAVSFVRLNSLHSL